MFGTWNRFINYIHQLRDVTYNLNKKYLVLCAYTNSDCMKRELGSLRIDSARPSQLVLGVVLRDLELIRGGQAGYPAESGLCREAFLRSCLPKAGEVRCWFWTNTHALLYQIHCLFIVQGRVSALAGLVYVNDVSSCMTWHQWYVASMKNSSHRYAHVNMFVAAIFSIVYVITTFVTTVAR
jgi:hypothetical protein